MIKAQLNSQSLIHQEIDALEFITFDKWNKFKPLKGHFHNVWTSNVWCCLSRDPYGDCSRYYVLVFIFVSWSQPVIITLSVYIETLHMLHLNGKEMIGMWFSFDEQSTLVFWCWRVWKQPMFTFFVSTDNYSKQLQLQRWKVCWGQNSVAWFW